MNDKKVSRLRRSHKTRLAISRQAKLRLAVYRTPRHIYAQILNVGGSEVLASASTVEKQFRSEKTGNREAASKIGALIAERATAKGITEVAFDRSGYKYHGRIQSLADAARETGLKF
jgi:large subunit ribosomal protein L18